MVSFVWAGMAIGAQNSYAATNYDLTTNETAAEIQAGASAGRGVGQAGAPNIGNTNVSFSDFGGYAPDVNNPRSQDGSNPADLLPINHQNTVTSTNGPLQVYSYASSQIKPGVWGSQTSGTSAMQAPLSTNPGQILPYGGTRGSLPPVSMGLQATQMPTAFAPIPSGQYSFGFNPMPYSPYQGIYGQPGSASTPSGLFAGFATSNILPPTSMGSVDFNIRSR